MNDLIDLHVHSKYSDGKHSPVRLVSLAQQNRVRAFALTDHDSVSGVEECIIAGYKAGVEIIAGIELSANFKNDDVHIVGLNVDYKSPILLKEIEKIRHMRIKKVLNILYKLNEIGVRLKIDDVEKIAHGKILERPHIAEAMVNKGYVKNNEDAYNHFIGKNRFAYQGDQNNSLENIAKVIKGSGGIPILAHPRQLAVYNTEKRLADALKEYKEAGIEGIEIYCNYNTEKDRQFLLNAANRVGMLISGGSDFHGTKGAKVQMGTGKGTIRMNYNVLEKMKQSKLWIER